MDHLADIRHRVSRYQPQLIATGESRRAAVALVLRDQAGGMEALLIERAHHQDDPWSGHMAFPGGGVDPGDTDARAAAERETLEEVGVSLQDAECLGRLDDQQGRARGARLDLVISAFVYFLPQAVETRPNYEVKTVLWVPLDTMLEPDRQVRRLFSVHGNEPYPAIQIGESDDHVVWGLTYRFLDMFFQIIGRPLPGAPR